jgi:hypothetical protein
MYEYEDVPAPIRAEFVLPEARHSKQPDVPLVSSNPHNLVQQLFGDALCQNALQIS